MADQHPTDEYCKPHEYITEAPNGTWFICGANGVLRLHPEEIPQDLRLPPIEYKKDTLLDYVKLLPLAVFLLVLFPFSFWMWDLHHRFTGGKAQDEDRQQLQEAHNAWVAAAYRDAGVYQRSQIVWTDDGFNSWGSPSATKGR